MSRYKLVVQYDGSEFSGWQLQNKSRTVQGVLENAVQKITNSTDRIPVHGSGRTDAGVHAWAQVAHTDMKLKLDEGNSVQRFQIPAHNIHKNRNDHWQLVLTLLSEI